MKAGDPLAEDEFYFTHGRIPTMSHTSTADNDLLMALTKEQGLLYTGVWMNPQRAGKLGIKNGDAIEMENSVTGQKAGSNVYVTELIRPDTVFIIYSYPHVACPPYESVYAEAAQEVSTLYGRWGVDVPEDEADHVGAELEFAAFLLSLETPESLADADRFLAEHLLTWLPRFAADVARESRLRFYQALGRLLAAALPEGAGVVLAGS